MNQLPGWLRRMIKGRSIQANQSRQDFTCGKCERHHIIPESHNSECRGKSK